MVPAPAWLSGAGHVDEHFVGAQRGEFDGASCCSSELWGSAIIREGGIGRFCSRAVCIRSPTPGGMTSHTGHQRTDPECRQALLAERIGPATRTRRWEPDAGKPLRVLGAASGRGTPPATPQKRWREDSQQHRGVMRGDSARSSAACTLWRRAGKIWAAQRIVKNMPARQNR